MECSLEQKLTKLLDAYSHRYDIERNVEVEGTMFPAMATYYLRDENYLLSRQHVLSAVEQHEYVSIYLTEHLDVEKLTELIELTKRTGLQKIRPSKDHMVSYVTLVVLANTIDPAAVKLMKKTRYRKNYRLSFHGWMEYRVAAMEASTDRFFSNPAGGAARKLMEQNFAPKQESKKGAHKL